MPGIMLEYSPNSTELVVLDFESFENIMAPSTYTFNLKRFPGISKGTLRNLTVRPESLHLTEEGDDNSFLEPPVNS